MVRYITCAYLLAYPFRVYRVTSPLYALVRSNSHVMSLWCRHTLLFASSGLVCLPSRIFSLVQPYLRHLWLFRRFCSLFRCLVPWWSRSCAVSPSLSRPCVVLPLALTLSRSCTSRSCAVLPSSLLVLTPSRSHAISFSCHPAIASSCPCVVSPRVTPDCAISLSSTGSFLCNLRSCVLPAFVENKADLLAGRSSAWSTHSSSHGSGMERSTTYASACEHSIERRNACPSSTFADARSIRRGLSATVKRNTSLCSLMYYAYM